MLIQRLSQQQNSYESRDVQRMHVMDLMDLLVTHPQPFEAV
jgi:hypothetical protein